MNDERSIWQKVIESNEAWRSGRPEDVGGLFAPEVVMEGADGRVLANGRDAMVASYVEYCRQVKTLALAVRAHAVHVFGDTAVVTYTFEVTYEAGGQTSRESGAERLVLARRGGAWEAVWRLQTSTPAT
jgi:uncharacterized protein (TIGR02246 family)